MAAIALPFWGNAQVSSSRAGASRPALLVLIAVDQIDGHALPVAIAQERADAGHC